jgi:hypothetical protein
MALIASADLTAPADTGLKISADFSLHGAYQAARAWSYPDRQPRHSLKPVQQDVKNQQEQKT